MFPSSGRSSVQSVLSFPYSKFSSQKRKFPEEEKQQKNAEKKEKPAMPATVKVGNLTLKPGKNLLPLLESSSLYRECEARADFSPLRDRLEAQGFLFLRGILNREKILGAREAILKRLSDLDALAAGSPPGSACMKNRMSGWTIYAESGEDVGKDFDEASENLWRKLAQSQAVRYSSFDSPELHQFYHNLFGSSCYHAFPDCTWLRMKGHKELTAEHTDYYYFKQNTNIFGDYLKPQEKSACRSKEDCFLCGKIVCEEGKNSLRCAVCSAPAHSPCVKNSPLSTQLSSSGLPEGEFHCELCANEPFPYWTCWISLGAVGEFDGRLAVLPATHKAFQGYHNMKTQLPTEIKKSFLTGNPWYSANLEPGDLILFNIKTVHAASQNLSDNFRLSCDTRVAAGPFKEKNTDNGEKQEKCMKKRAGMGMMSMK